MAANSSEANAKFSASVIPNALTAFAALAETVGSNLAPLAFDTFANIL
jgi:hypothetical protein